MPEIPRESVEALWNGELPKEPFPGSDRREVDDAVFWLHMLAPLFQLSPKESDGALRELASRPHAHPHDGVQTFTLSLLRARLRQYRAADRSRNRR